MITRFYLIAKTNYPLNWLQYVIKLKKYSDPKKIYFKEYIKARNRVRLPNENLDHVPSGRASR